MTMNESPIERRQREALERCTTDAQQATVTRLHAEEKVAYPEKRQGKGVVAAFRRYCETRDPEKIDAGLYHFSTQGAGGLNEIAHFDIHGFRHVYAHPAIYLQELLFPEMERYRGDHSFYVYTDGMTAGEVADAILELAHEHHAALLEDARSKIKAKRLAQATELAESLGMKLVQA
jgi:hypothetical protein